MKEKKKAALKTAAFIFGDRLYQWVSFLPAVRAIMSIITAIATNRKNRTLATPAAAEAMPPNLKIAAIMEMMKKITAQRNIFFHLL